MQLSALEPKQFLPEIASESGIMVHYNRLWHTMEFKDIIHEDLSDHGSFKGVL
jgi:hypothetical protein